jgi:hypothetical protein
MKFVPFEVDEKFGSGKYNTTGPTPAPLRGGGGFLQMLVALQFPFTDVRSFVQRATHQLAAPFWSMLDVDKIETLFGQWGRFGSDASDPFKNGLRKTLIAAFPALLDSILPISLSGIRTSLDWLFAATVLFVVLWLAGS